MTNPRSTATEITTAALDPGITTFCGVLQRDWERRQAGLPLNFVAVNDVALQERLAAEESDRLREPIILVAMVPVRRYSLQTQRTVEELDVFGNPVPPEEVPE